jgi:hypothetical protein
MPSSVLRFALVVALEQIGSEALGIDFLPQLGARRARASQLFCRAMR